MPKIPMAHVIVKMRGATWDYVAISICKLIVYALVLFAA